MADVCATFKSLQISKYRSDKHIGKWQRLG